jgi:hypothetical protein
MVKTLAIVVDQISLIVHVMVKVWDMFIILYIDDTIIGEQYIHTSL